MRYQGGSAIPDPEWVSSGGTLGILDEQGEFVMGAFAVMRGLIPSAAPLSYETEGIERLAIEIEKLSLEEGARYGVPIWKCPDCGADVMSPVPECPDCGYGKDRRP